MGFARAQPILHSLFEGDTGDEVVDEMDQHRALQAAFEAHEECHEQAEKKDP